MLRALAFTPPLMLSRASLGRASILVIAGPTAVGKSALALKLARSMGAEIVSADSVQVFRGLDVGANKASVAERASVPHHLLDIADPRDAFSAGDFFRAARGACEDILSRGNVPIVVGGTMMYVRWLIHGRPATPPATARVKAAIEAEVARLGGDWDAGVAILAERDPKRAAALTVNDWYRLKRALEVVETTGVAMTDMPLQGGAPNTANDPRELDYDFRCVFLYDDRANINRRIDARCEQMILPRSGPASDARCFDPEKSVLTEVANLLKARAFVAETSPVRAIGYRQTIAYLIERALAVVHGDSLIDAKSSQVSEMVDCALTMQRDPAEAFRDYVAEFQKATRGYAKQQISWYRKEETFRWVKAGPGAYDAIRAMLDLSENEYRVFREVSALEQRDARNIMIQQGRDMKTYITRKEVLQEGSTAEQIAIALAERQALDMADCLELDELKHIQTLVER